LGKPRLEPAQLEKVNGILSRVYFKEVPPGTLKDELQKIGLSEEAAKTLATDIIGYQLLPVSYYFTDAVAALKELGGDFTKYSVNSVVSGPPSNIDMAVAAMGEAFVHGSGETEFNIIDTLAAYLDKQTDRVTTVRELSRDTKVRGSGLTPEIAEKLVASVERQRSEVNAKFSRPAQPAPTAPPDSKKKVPGITPEQFVQDFLREHPARVNTLVEARLRTVLESRVRGVRTDADTIQRLIKPEKIGGVGLVPNDATELITALTAALRGVTIAAEEPAPAITPLRPRSESDLGRTYPTPPAATVFQTVRQSAFTAGASVPSIIEKKSESVTPEDDREASLIKEKILPNVVSDVERDTDAEMTAAVVRVMDAAALALPPALTERLRTIITSRLKDVRDTLETKDLLTRPVEKGGMGLAPDAATKMGAAIEAQFAAVHGALQERSTQQKKQFVEQSLADTADRKVSREQKDSDELDRLYSAVTRKPVARSITPPTPYTLPPTPSSPPPTPFTPPSTKMQDVRPPTPARLTGPIEELKNLTLTDFRRLSSDPTEACGKLEGKLDLLEEQGYAKRIEGIKAWQESEVNRLYMQILQASFGAGTPISAVISARTAANTPTLTEREVDAIMEFNRKLKF